LGFPFLDTALESRSNNSWILGPDNSVPVNQWSHLTSVWKSGQIEKLYIDGIEVANDANPATGSLNVQEWVVGQDRNIGGRFFDGDIQDLRIWTRAFSASEVSALSSAPGPVWEHSGPTSFNGVNEKLNLPNPTAGNGATELTIVDHHHLGQAGH